MNKFIATAVAIVLSLGIANAQDGRFPDYPFMLTKGDEVVQVKAGQTTYVRLDQDSMNWKVKAKEVKDMVLVNKGEPGKDDDYVPNAYPVLKDKFWVLDEGTTPSNWTVFIPKSQASLTGQFRNTYGIRIPSGLGTGRYTMQTKVRHNDSGVVYTFPLNVEVTN